MISYYARLLSARATETVDVAAEDLEQALVRLTDELARTAAEGRPLPQRVELFESEGDTLAATGALTPRKGCCSGWEVTWHNPFSDSSLVTYSL